MSVEEEAIALHEVNLTDARNLSPLYTEAVREEHPIVIRRRDERGVLLSKDQLLHALEPYVFHTHIYPEDEDGGFTLWIDELALGEHGVTPQEARDALVASVRVSARHFFRKWSLYRHLPDRAVQYPYYLRIALATDAEMKQMLFAPMAAVQMPRPKWGRMRQFCRTQGYGEDDDGSHVHYDKVLTDGSSSWTMVSHGKESVQVPKELWTSVWRHQLRLKSEADFWNGLKGEPFDYDIPPTADSPEPLPDFLQRFLHNTLHYTDEQIAATSRDKAQRLLDAHWSQSLLD